MALTLPTGILDVWRRIWGARTPTDVALVTQAPDVGFAQQSRQTFSFPIGVAAIGVAQQFLLNFDEGLYDITWTISYVSGGAADQQMAFRVSIKDINNSLVWSTVLGFITGQQVVYRKRCALRSGQGVFVANEAAWTLAATFAVLAITVDPIF